MHIQSPSTKRFKPIFWYTANAFFPAFVAPNHDYVIGIHFASSKNRRYILMFVVLLYNRMKPLIDYALLVVGAFAIEKLVDYLQIPFVVICEQLLSKYL